MASPFASRHYYNSAMLEFYRRRVKVKRGMRIGTAKKGSPACVLAEVIKSMICRSGFTLHTVRFQSGPLGKQCHRRLRFFRGVMDYFNGTFHLKKGLAQGLRDLKNLLRLERRSKCCQLKPEGMQ